MMEDEDEDEDKSEDKDESGYLMMIHDHLLLMMLIFVSMIHSQILIPLHLLAFSLILVLNIIWI